MERGCLVLDLGGGTTGLAHFADGRLALVEQVPYGGDHVTGDLAYGLSTSRAARGADKEPVSAAYSGAPATITRASRCR